MIVYHLKSESLLRVANNIFGDIIKDAYIEHFDTDDLLKLGEDYAEISDETELNFDSDTIVLVFNNGKMVKFLSSEWSAISICESLNVINKH